MTSGIGHGGIESPQPQVNPLETQENQTEGTEAAEKTNKVDDATLKPAEVVEKGDYKAAEALQEVFTAAVDAVPETKDVNPESDDDPTNHEAREDDSSDPGERGSETSGADHETIPAAEETVEISTEAAQAAAVDSTTEGPTSEGITESSAADVADLLESDEADDGMVRIAGEVMEEEEPVQGKTTSEVMEEEEPVQSRTAGEVIEEEEPVQSRTAGEVMEEEEPVQGKTTSEVMEEEEEPVQGRTFNHVMEEEEPDQGLTNPEIISRLPSEIAEQLPEGAEAFSDQAAADIVKMVIAGDSNDYVSPTRDAIQENYQDLTKIQADGLMASSLLKASQTLEKQITTIVDEDESAPIGDDAQLANIDLQNMLQKQQQTIQMLSNISKVLHDTALAVIRKIG